MAWETKQLPHQGQGTEQRDVEGAVAATGNTLRTVQTKQQQVKQHSQQQQVQPLHTPVNLEADLVHLNKKMKAALAGVHKKFNGKVEVQEIMEAAGVWWNEMPKIERFKNPTSGAYEICWNNACGRCKWGARCDFAATTHSSESALSDAEADATIKVLQPGIDKMLSDSYHRDSAWQRRPAGGGKRRHY